MAPWTGQPAFWKKNIEKAESTYGLLRKEAGDDDSGYSSNSMDGADVEGRGSITISKRLASFIVAVQSISMVFLVYLVYKNTVFRLESKSPIPTCKSRIRITARKY
jgi:hypothetical protein